MATTTPNIGLTLPDGIENITRSIINGNNTLIDTAVGALNSKFTTVGLGNMSTLGDLITAMKSALSATADNVVLFVHFGVASSYDSDVFQWLTYSGFIRKGGTNYYGMFSNNHAGHLVVGTSDAGTNNYYNKTVGTLKT